MTRILTISITDTLYLKFKEYKRTHGNFNFSGWVSDYLFEMLKRADENTCTHYVDGYCQSESSINECSYVLTGRCLLNDEVPSLQ